MITAYCCSAAIHITGVSGEVYWLDSYGFFIDPVWTVAVEPSADAKLYYRYGKCLELHKAYLCSSCRKRRDRTTFRSEEKAVISLTTRKLTL